MENHKKVFSTQILIKVEVEVVKPHFKVNMEARMVNIINMKVSFMEEEEVGKVVAEIIEVNNQITTWRHWNLAQAG